MDDLISRQDAIDVLDVGAELLRRALDDADIVGVARATYEWGLGLIESYISDMKELPSAQSEPCEDAVSRNAIIRKLNTMDRYVSEELILCDTDKKFPKNEVFIVDDVYEEIVENLPSAQPKPQWIPCSEKYPDMDERVLVYTLSHEYHVWDCMSNRADNYFWEDEDGLYHDKYEVDLWMPLSQPYRKDGD